MIAFAVCMVIMIGAVGCSKPTNRDVVATEEPHSNPTEEIPSATLDIKKDYRVLFIGNSFTENNNMPKGIFAPLCKKAGYNVIVDQVTKGSYILESFANSADTYGAKIDSYLKKYKYDMVILQEQSHRSITNFGSFKRGVRALSEKIKENGAEVYLYETWGYKKGHGSLASYGGSTKAMAKKLHDAYISVADSVEAKVIYAGMAMLDVYTNHASSVEIYNTTDLYHPSVAGSTLIAYTIFSTLFSEDVRNVSYRFGKAERDNILKQAAYNAAIEKSFVV